MDLFGDPLEGITYKTWIENKISQSIKVTNPSIPKDKRNEIETREINKIKRNVKDLIGRQKTQYVSCWFRGNTESFAMWKLYSNSDSVVIKINPQELFNKIESITSLTTIPNNFYKLLIGDVKYVNFREIDPFKKNIGHKVIYPALRKDESFSHEKEFRFVLQAKKVQEKIKGYEFELGDLNLMNFQIICHPDMEKYKVKNLTNFINMKKLSLNIVESELKQEWFEEYKSQLKDSI